MPLGAQALDRERGPHLTQRTTRSTGPNEAVPSALAFLQPAGASPLPGGQAPGLTQARLAAAATRPTSHNRPLSRAGSPEASSPCPGKHRRSRAQPRLHLAARGSTWCAAPPSSGCAGFGPGLPLRPRSPRGIASQSAVSAGDPAPCIPGTFPLNARTSPSPLAPPDPPLSVPAHGSGLHTAEPAGCRAPRAPAPADADGLARGPRVRGAPTPSLSPRAGIPTVTEPCAPGLGGAGGCRTPRRPTPSPKSPSRLAAPHGRLPGQMGGSAPRGRGGCRPAAEARDPPALPGSSPAPPGSARPPRPPCAAAPPGPEAAGLGPRQPRLVGSE